MWPFSLLGIGQKTPPKRRSVTFEFEKTSSDLFSEIYRPLATVKLWSESSKSWKKVTMIVDTGADYTIIPRYIATWVGIDEDKKAQKYTNLGLGGEETVYFLPDVKVKIGPFERQVPIGIINSTKVPPLLGRQLMLNDFEVLLKQHTVTFSAP
ncbi:MAG: retropepsin-like domain-containing protein [bacterium]|nr:retropepsin-like domain-containing protein [bacterium]